METLLYLIHSDVFLQPPVYAYDSSLAVLNTCNLSQFLITCLGDKVLYPETPEVNLVELLLRCLDKIKCRIVTVQLVCELFLCRLSRLVLYRFYVVILTLFVWVLLTSDVGIVCTEEIILLSLFRCVFQSVSLYGLVAVEYGRVYGVFRISILFKYKGRLMQLCTC